MVLDVAFCIDDRSMILILGGGEWSGSDGRAVSREGDGQTVT
jgi:hypothetical protein